AVTSRSSRARFLLPYLSAIVGEQHQIDHRRKRPDGGNDARRTVEIEKMPLLPQCERGGHVGIGGGEINERGRRHQGKAHERELGGPGIPAASSSSRIAAATPYRAPGVTQARTSWELTTMPNPKLCTASAAARKITT